MKTLLTACMVFLLGGVAFADSISGTVPCSDGGGGSFSGTYDFVSGSVAVSITLNDCNGFNGSVTTSGTLKLTSSTSVNTNLTIDSGLSSKSGQVIMSCHETIVGTYSLATFVLSGTISLNCTANGSAPLPIDELLFGTYL